MCVCERFVDMPVSMRLGAFAAHMTVLMMFIVTMQMGVHQILVGMLMLMLLGEHQIRGNDHH